MTKRTATVQDVFGDTILSWGQKHFNRKLIDVWNSDRSYLIRACNLDTAKPRSPQENIPPRVVCRLVEIALELERGDSSKALRALEEYQRWEALSQRGIGLGSLPKPTPDECRQVLASCTVLGGHSDLDGIYSLAIAIEQGHALGGPKKASAASIRMLNYHFTRLAHYTSALALTKGSSLVVIDFAAHPQAKLTFDHHSTCLSFWEEGSPLPRGIFDTSIPSCPRLLANYCEFKIKEEFLQGCDMVDGAMYPNLEEALSLKNPFCALEYALGVDVTDITRKNVVLTLAQNALDPYSVLEQPIWKARLKLLQHEMDEQRGYWESLDRVVAVHASLAIIDARECPHNASKFRYLPFEIPTVAEKPYILSLRGGRGPESANIGLARNPFIKDKSCYENHNLDVGALLKSLGQGGGRPEVGSLTIPASELDKTLTKIVNEVERHHG